MLTLSAIYSYRINPTTKYIGYKEMGTSTLQRIAGSDLFMDCFELLDQSVTSGNSELYKSITYRRNLLKLNFAASTLNPHQNLFQESTF